MEFLRANCKKKGVFMPLDLCIHTKLMIYELVDYRHMTDKERQELNADLTDLQRRVDPGMETKQTMAHAGVGALIVGLAGALAWKHFNN